MHSWATALLVSFFVAGSIVRLGRRGNAIGSEGALSGGSVRRVS